jgi:hypothetical protein
MLNDLIVTASDTPFIFKAQDIGGYHYSFISSNFTLLGDHSKEVTLPAPPPDSKNWQEYAEFLKTDTRFTYASVSYQSSSTYRNSSFHCLVLEGLLTR